MNLNYIDMKAVIQKNQEQVTIEWDNLQPDDILDPILDEEGFLDELPIPEDFDEDYEVSPEEFEEELSEIEKLIDLEEFDSEEEENDEE